MREPPRSRIGRAPSSATGTSVTVSTAPGRGHLSKTFIGGSRPVTIRECHTTTATSSAGNIASEQVTILRESSSGRRVKQIASKPKSLAVTVPRDSGDGERSKAQRHYGEKGGKHPWWNVPSQRKAVTGLLEGW